MLKKLTSFLLVAMLLATLTPSVIFAAETTESIPFAFAIDTSAGGNASKVQSNGRLFARGGTYENLRQTYISFDLSGLESKILAASEINLVLYCTRYNGEEAQNFNVYLLPDGKAKYVNSELTYNIAVSNSMATGGELVASNSTKMSQYTYYTSGDMASYLKNALADNSDSKVAFRIDGTDTAAQSFVVSGHSLSVTYDDTAVADQSHVSKVANLLEWTNLSSETTDSVTQNLTLPSKYYGADITWASNDSTVSSDGTVTLPKGDAKEVTLTANFNYNGATDTKTFTFTVPAISGKTETINHSQKTHIRGGDYADKVQGISFGEVYVQQQPHKSINDRYAFYQFDLSGYEEKIYRATSATITLQSQQASQPVTITLLPDSCDNWSASTLTFNIADSMGMLANSVPNSERAVQNGIVWSANTAYTTNNFASLLKSSLAENPTNSLVTFRVYGDNQTLTTIKHASFMLNLTYYEDEIDKNAMFEEIKDSLEWSNISSQEENNISQNLTLPEKLYGFELSWKSDNEAIDALTGKVTRSKTDDSTVNLTATVKNGTASYDKTFVLTVPKAEKTNITLSISDKAATRGGEHGDNIQDLSYAVSFNRIYTRKESHNDANDRYIFYSFDLSGYEEKIMKASDITFTMNNQTSGSGFSTALLPKTDYNWEYATLTYNKSNALGMMDSAITVASGATCKTESFTTDNFAESLKNVLSSNPTSSVVTIRIYADKFSEAIEFNAPAPKLNISYYDMDLNSDEFFADVKDDLVWDDITTQDKDNVIADLNLPSKFYGYDVTWTSDDEAVSSSGEVEVSGEVNPVKLTATVSNGTNSFSKEFDVTVSDKAYALDFSNAMGSGAKVYAAQETAGVLVFAAYADSTLISVTPVNVTLADGENLVNSLLKTNGATEVKIMLVSDMDTLTPLCTSKVK